MMKSELIGILGLNPNETTEQNIIEEVRNLVNDLRGKQGFVYGGIIRQLKSSGFLRFDETRQIWTARITPETMEKILQGYFS